MKPTLFITIASVASVFAAALPGAKDTGSFDPLKIANPATSPVSDTPPFKTNIVGTVNEDKTSVLNQGMSPTTKQEPDIFSDFNVDEDYTPFVITAPTKDTFYTKGETVTIQWSNGLEGPFLIQLLTGELAFSMRPTKVKLRGEGTTGKYQWTVPKDLTDGVYAFKFTFKNNGKQQDTYSDQFRISTTKSA